MERRHSEWRRVAEYLGLTSSTKPKPSPRRAFVALLWVLPLVVVAALLATAVERADGPQWLRVLLLVAPIWVLIALMSRRNRNDT